MPSYFDQGRRWKRTKHDQMWYMVTVIGCLLLEKMLVRYHVKGKIRREIYVGYVTLSGRCLDLGRG